MRLSDAQEVWRWHDGVDTRSNGRVGSMSVIGYDVVAMDGRIGTIDESSGHFGANCLVVDAEPCLAGRKILVPADTVRKVDRADRIVYLDPSKADVEDSPGYDPETFVWPQYRDHVAHYFAGTYRDTPAQ